MKIAFVGDSFCADLGSHSRYPLWTDLLLKEFNASAIQMGISGDCLFHSYSTLLEHIDEADYIICCVTAPERLPNHHNIPMNSGFADDTVPFVKDTSISKDVYDAARNYYKYLINLDFHEMAQRGILIQMDRLLLAKKKKCIWFPCFYHSITDYKITSGPSGTTPLYYYAEQNDEDIPDSNHFSKEQNENMFRLLKDIIDNDAFDPRSIDTNTLLIPGQIRIHYEIGANNG